MYARFTQQLKSKLVANLVEKKFSAAREKLTVNEHELAISLYRAHYEGVLELMLELPERAFHKAGVVRTLSGTNQHDMFDLPEHKIIMACDFSPYAMRNFCGLIDVRKGAKLEHFGVDVTKFVDKKKDFEKKISEAYSELGAIVGAYGTVAKLLKAWPDLEPHCEFLKEEKKGLPAIPVERLNKTYLS